MYSTNEMNIIFKRDVKINDKNLMLTRGIRHGWVWLDSTQSNLVPAIQSVGLVRLSSDRHDLIPPPLTASLRK